MSMAALSQAEAEALAARALAWMSDDETMIGGFLGTSGLAVADLPGLAGDPAFLVAVLDYLLADDARVIAFCDSEGVSYDRPMAALARLPGGASVHWT